MIKKNHLFTFINTHKKNCRIQNKTKWNIYYLVIYDFFDKDEIGYTMHKSKLPFNKDKKIRFFF